MEFDDSCFDTTSGAFQGSGNGDGCYPTAGFSNGEGFGDGYSPGDGVPGGFGDGLGILDKIQAWGLLDREWDTLIDHGAGEDSGLGFGNGESVE